jgi:hypothetical protein
VRILAASLPAQNDGPGIVRARRACLISPSAMDLVDPLPYIPLDECRLVSAARHNVTGFISAGPDGGLERRE